MKLEIERSAVTAPRGSRDIRCAIPGCTRPTSFASGKGRAHHHCRYHVQHKARHGSHWHGTYLARDLKPYIAAAADWLRANRESPLVVAAWTELQHVLAGAGRIDPATNLRGQPPKYRARVAFARLREAGVSPDRLMAIYIGVSALIQDDYGSHRTEEFRLVQAAKAAHRLASGTHRRWEMWNPVGSSVPVELHAYPRSSGLVLRQIGATLDKACREIAASALVEVIEAKTAKADHHPSHRVEAA